MSIKFAERCRDVPDWHLTVVNYVLLMVTTVRFALFSQNEGSPDEDLFVIATDFERKP
jgi:hypothetical protein